MKLIDIFRPTKFIVTLFVVLSVVCFLSWASFYYCWNIMPDPDFPDLQVEGNILCSDGPPYIFYYGVFTAIAFTFFLLKPLFPIGDAIFASKKLGEAEILSVFGVFSLVYLYLVSSIIVFVVRLISSRLKLSKSYAK